MSNKQQIKEIDEWLPQTQCTQCSYPRCYDYATAINAGDADINQCPPGGDVTIRGLAALLGRIGKPLNPKFGIHKQKEIAVIDEDVCIGCVMCIKACPTDAIIGAAKVMHTVVEQDCTGCELCLEPCPVDCISMVKDQQDEQLHWRWPDYSPERTKRARQLTNAKIQREASREAERSTKKKLNQLRNKGGSEQIKLDIAASLERIKQRQAE